MSKVIFYLIIKPISLLPYPIIYGISNVISFLFFYVIPYRKKTVTKNIKNSFPQKDKKELNIIARKFYTHLSDIIVESIKLFSITQKQIDYRFSIENPEILQTYFDQGRDVILVGGHYNNWEILAVGINQIVPHDCFGIYTKLSDPFFDDKMKSSRSKFGLKMINTREVSSNFIKKNKTPRMTIFGADQSPTYSKNIHWTNFLNQDTAVALGTERFSKKYNLPVIFCSINKRKRGIYSTKLSVLTENPQDTEDGEITEMHTSKLENQINIQPEFWLWTHKRWKRKR
ncbi:MAG: lysophospholipid acyltransferase family protein [Bacteroidia bacterium]|nr:lysophospholipid acyltransferase family protein [Bacteroidia bacterium]